MLGESRQWQRRVKKTKGCCRKLVVGCLLLLCTLTTDAQYSQSWDVDWGSICDESPWLDKCQSGGGSTWGIAEILIVVIVIGLIWKYIIKKIWEGDSPTFKKTQAKRRGEEAKQRPKPSGWATPNKSNASTQWLSKFLFRFLIVIGLILGLLLISIPFTNM